MSALPSCAILASDCLLPFLRWRKYKTLARVELVGETNVQWTTRTITLHANSVSADVARKAIEQALLEQAGIKLTSLDDRHVRVVQPQTRR